MLTAPSPPLSTGLLTGLPSPCLFHPKCLVRWATAKLLSLAIQVHQLPPLCMRISEMVLQPGQRVFQEEGSNSACRPSAESPFSCLLKGEGKMREMCEQAWHLIVAL